MRSLFDREYVYDKVPYRWLLYIGAALCALIAVAYISFAGYYFEFLFALLLLCKAAADTVFGAKARQRKWIYASAIMDVAACAGIMRVVFSDAYYIGADEHVILLWLAAQAVWGAVMGMMDELERARGLLNGLSAFLLSFSLVALMWAHSSFTLVSVGLAVHFTVRLIMALNFRNKIDKAIKNYRHVSMASNGQRRF